jgi:hypothetical protein
MHQFGNKLGAACKNYTRKKHSIMDIEQAQKILKNVEKSSGSLRYAMLSSSPELLKQFRSLVEFEFQDKSNAEERLHSISLLHVEQMKEFFSQGLASNPRLNLLIQGLKQEEDGQAAVNFADDMLRARIQYQEWLSTLNPIQCFQFATYYFYLSRAVLLEAKKNHDILEGGMGMQSLHLVMATLIFIQQAEYGIVNSKN